MFIGRRLDGSIYGCWTSRQASDADHPGIEDVADNHPELIEFLAPKPLPDLSDPANQQKAILALALCIAQVGGLTVPQIKAMFKNKWDSLP
jgi:hypothetical protein